MGAEDASLALCPTTADEDGLRELAEKTQQLAPALSALRATAVDRTIFEPLGRQLCGEQPAPESEASDMDEGQKPTHSGRLGWRVGWTRTRSGDEAREFVDPSGRRFSTMDTALASLEGCQES